MLLPVTEELEWQYVHVEPLMVVMAKDHPLVTAGKLDIKRVADVPFILFEEDYALNQVILDACMRRGLTAQVVAQSRQIDFIVELAALGVGVAFLPRMLLERRYHPSIRYALLDEPQTEWRIALAWRRGAYLSHAAQEWLALTREMHTTNLNPSREDTAREAS
jgi:DNA-binding transcriptional LysR family regulator